MITRDYAAATTAFIVESPPTDKTILNNFCKKSAAWLAKISQADAAAGKPRPTLAVMEDILAQMGDNKGSRAIVDIEWTKCGRIKRLRATLSGVADKENSLRRTDETGSPAANRVSRLFPRGDTQ